MPIAYKLAMLKCGAEMIPVVSAAVISGAITGAQTVPFSDKTVMTAAACGLTPIYHAKTQIFQILFVAVMTILAYLIIGMGKPLVVAYIPAMIIISVVHFVFSKKSRVL